MNILNINDVNKLCFVDRASRYIYNETNLMHYLSSVSADSQLKRTTRTNCHIYALLRPDDGLLATPKHVEVQ
jgi:hypothetical protein